MYEADGGTGDGANLGTIPHEALIDELVLTYDRADGTLKIGGKTCNLEVALDMCQRAARQFEVQLRVAAVAAVAQQRAELERVQQILAGARPAGRG